MLLLLLLLLLLLQEALMSMLRRTKLDILYHRVANLQERINTQTKYDYFAI